MSHFSQFSAKTNDQGGKYGQDIFITKLHIPFVLTFPNLPCVLIGPASQHNEGQINCSVHSSAALPGFLHRGAEEQEEEQQKEQQEQQQEG
jgi:hypothetical protein